MSEPSSSTSQYKVYFPVKAYDGAEFLYEGPLTSGQLHGIIAMIRNLFEDDFPNLVVKMTEESQDEINIEYALSKVLVFGEVDYDEVPDDWSSSYDFEYAALYTPTDKNKILIFYTEDDNLEGVHTVFNHYEAGINRSNAQIFPSIKDKQNGIRKVIQ